MDYINRKLDISERLGQKSVLLLGPRQTGKTSYIKNQLGTAVKAKWDLLNTRTRIQLERDPRLLYEQIAALDMDPQSDIIVIDEIQKVPALLDVVHEAIEEKGIRFLLTGSSARKLRKEGVNLLGGRASRATLLPFVYEELRTTGEKDLEEIFLRGMLPPAWDDPDPDGFLDDYISGAEKGKSGCFSCWGTASVLRTGEAPKPVPKTGNSDQAAMRPALILPGRKGIAVMGTLTMLLKEEKGIICLIIRKEG